MYWYQLSDLIGWLLTTDLIYHFQLQRSWKNDDLSSQSEGDIFQAIQVRKHVFLKTSLIGTIWSQFNDGRNRSTSNIYNALLAYGWGVSKVPVRSLDLYTSVQRDGSSKQLNKSSAVWLVSARAKKSFYILVVSLNCRR